MKNGASCQVWGHKCVMLSVSTWISQMLLTTYTPRMWAYTNTNDVLIHSWASMHRTGTTFFETEFYMTAIQVENGHFAKT